MTVPMAVIALCIGVAALLVVVVAALIILDTYARREIDNIVIGRDEW